MGGAMASPYRKGLSRWDPSCHLPWAGAFQPHHPLLVLGELLHTERGQRASSGSAPSSLPCKCFSTDVLL